MPMRRRLSRRRCRRATDFPQQLVTVEVAAEFASDGLRTMTAAMADFTPPAYISLLFTELGVLTPSAVSDELIKLYY